MAAEANITLPEDLLARTQEIAASEGKTADQLAVEALKREIARKLLRRMRDRASVNRMGMNDDQIEEYVNRIIHEYRAEEAASQSQDSRAVE